ncbi:MAG: DUF3137 domain-containing protein [Alphaproteobacteria bacterium]|nr:DUF3137 domain-containing protein [Alphaproteobacteria bacterium]
MIQQKVDIKAEFDEYFWRKMYPLMAEKEKVRQRYVSDFKKLLVISLFVLPAIIYLLCNILYYAGDDGTVIGNLILAAITINVFIIRGPAVRYKRRVKNDMMNCFIKFFDEFKYEYGRGLNLHEMEDLYIFPNADECVVDDCFFGVYNGVNVKVCEQQLIKKIKTSKGSKKVTVFAGIILELDMNKNFSAHTFVIKDKGILNRLNGKKGFERVALEDVTFEKEFEAYCQNQIEARYLLTTAFMERMLKLKKLYKGSDIQFSFVNSKVIIAINTGKNMFEPCSLFKSNLQEKQIYQVFEQFMTIFKIVDILKLYQKNVTL